MFPILKSVNICMNDRALSTHDDRGSGSISRDVSLQARSLRHGSWHHPLPSKGGGHVTRPLSVPEGGGEAGDGEGA